MTKSFIPEVYEGENNVAVYSTQTFTLNEEQIESLSMGKFMEFITWFDNIESINKQDTLLLYYQVVISNILYGGVKIGNDN